MSTTPALRPLDFQPIIYQGQQMWLLRDPLQLSEQQLIFPARLAQLLPLLDGTLEADALHAVFSAQLGEPVPRAVISQTLEQLDQACLLDNERAATAMAAQLARYRAQPFRLPALAGLSYPEAPAEVSALFATYEAEAAAEAEEPWNGRAVVSPHIDYQRGGPVYGAVWRRARAALAEADLVLIFGTDHGGGPGSITLTSLPYATPFGVLPAAPALVEKLADALGPEAAFGLELNHRHEHSVELSAVWLHYIYQRLGREAAPMVPILTGSFHHFVSNGHHPREDKRLRAFVETLRAETAGQRVVAVASVDLAHIGPAFGDPFIMDTARRDRLRASDDQLMAAINAGDAERFYGEIAALQDRNRICGFSAIYLLLRFLGSVRGRAVAYEQCAADEQDSSLVSICGLLLE